MINMGKRIIARARGKGGPRYRAPSHKYLGRVEYVSATDITGEVKDIVHDPSRSAPVAIIKLEDGKEIMHIAPEGLKVGDTISYGDKIELGNVLPLSKIPEGVRISAIENYPNSGPKLCRSAGSFAMIVGRVGNKIRVQLSSGRIKELNKNCRATIGIPAGSGRLEKPFVKAGKRFYALRARGKLYPRTKGVVMGAVDHPFGGSKKASTPSRSVSRHAPPGAKVGSISPKRTGKRKGR